MPTGTRFILTGVVLAIAGCGGADGKPDLATTPPDLAVHEADLSASTDLAAVDLQGADLSATPDLANVDQAMVPSSAKALTAFSFAAPAAVGVIDESGKTITVALPLATNVTALVASYSKTGIAVSVGGTGQVSGTTPNDFSNPVTYLVTAADTSTASYLVTVNKIPSAPAISLPTAAAPVVTPLTVQGAAVGGATVDVVVKNGATVIGTGTGTANAGGRVDFVVAYTEPAAGTALSVAVTQTVGGQVSTAATVAVTQGIAGTVTFGANQNPGGVVADYSGAKMYLQAFSSALGGLPLQTQAFDVTVGTNAAFNSFPFRLPAAAAGTTYYFFAFRDSNGNGTYDAGEPVINAGARAPDLATQGGNNVDGYTMQPP